MITQLDLEEAIKECEGERNPNANTCIKLAAFYTIREHLFPSIREEEPEPIRSLEGYSYSGAPAVEYSGDSDFAQVISGKNQHEVFSIMDELMETLRVINPRLYASVMRRFE